MKQLALFGKKYTDTILFVNGVTNGETNCCNKIVETSGGLYNFFEVNLSNFRVLPLTSGLKKAYIVSDSSISKRTSFVHNIEESILPPDVIGKINEECSWLHICYLDDIECHGDISKINIPYSLDFCTDKERKPYLAVMKESTVIFDSRERKGLYRNIVIDTPIVLHDEYGFEIIESGKVVFREDNVPVKNLNVNGAGDMYAANFIKNYDHLGLFESAKLAMFNTTDILIQKEKS